MPLIPALLTLLSQPNTKAACVKPAATGAAAGLSRVLQGYRSCGHSCRPKETGSPKAKAGCTLIPCLRRTDGRAARSPPSGTPLRMPCMTTLACLQQVSVHQKVHFIACQGHGCRLLLPPPPPLPRSSGRSLCAWRAGAALGTVDQGLGCCQGATPSVLVPARGLNVAWMACCARQPAALGLRGPASGKTLNARPSQSRPSPTGHCSRDKRPVAGCAFGAGACLTAVTRLVS